MRVHGEGPLPADLMFVGEAPGEQEDRSGRPFVGKAGLLLSYLIDACLNVAELDWLQRSDIYITSLIKTRPPANRDPLPEEIAADAGELAQEFQLCNPDVVVTLGRFSTRAFLGDWADMEAVHGKAWRVQWGGRDVIVFPIFHPTAGLHAPDLFAFTALGFENLGKFLAGETHDRFGGALSAPEDTIGGQYVTGAPTTSWPASDVRPLAVDTEGTPEDPISVQITRAPGMAYVMTPQEARELPWDVPHLMHFALHDRPMLRSMGIKASGHLDDTMVQAYLLPTEPQGLKALARRHAGMAMQDYQQVVGHWVEKGKKKKKLVWSLAGRTLRDVEPQVRVDYSGRDPDATVRVHRTLRPRLTALGLDRLYAMEMGIIPIIDRMQTVGMQVDLEHFASLDIVLEREQERLSAQLADLAGYEVNVHSPKIAKLLFQELGIYSRKKTKSGKGLSTNDKILQALHHKALRTDGPNAPTTRGLDLVMTIREIRKMRSGFVGPLPEHVGPDHRLHPNILTTRVKTGRLAGKGINVLALPKHSEWGHLFREGFLAGPGRLLSSWDLSQIELRVLAHISGDTTMTNAFRAGRDLHAELGERLFGIPRERQSAAQRREQKIINFGLPMGMTATGLLEQFHKNGLLTKTIDDAEQLLYDTLHKVYPGVWAYQQEMRAEARRTGQVRDMWDRIYYLPAANAPFEQLREAAGREAGALPIQGGAAGLMKIGMAAAWELTQEFREGGYCEPWLQVHDDLLFEHDAELVSILQPLIASALNGAALLSVPVLCEHKSGTNWGMLE
jgi:uracil-DNA glycosylase family 4